MFTSKIVGTITPFSGTTTADKNGADSVMVQCIAGKMPNRNVISGTVAQRNGLEVGKTYLLIVREAGVHAIHGPQYDFLKVKELTEGIDIVDTCIAIGDPVIVNVEKPEASKEYQRKGDKVIGLRTVEEQKGVFKRATYSTTSTNLGTATEVKEGSSVDQNTLNQDDEILNKEKRDKAA